MLCQSRLLRRTCFAYLVAAVSVLAASAWAAEKPRMRVDDYQLVLHPGNRTSRDQLWAPFQPEIPAVTLLRWTSAALRGPRGSH